MVLFAEKAQLETFWQIFAYYESNLILAMFLASAIKNWAKKKPQQSNKLNIWTLIYTSVWAAIGFIRRSSGWAIKHVHTHKSRAIWIGVTHTTCWPKRTANISHPSCSLLSGWHKLIGKVTHSSTPWSINIFPLQVRRVKEFCLDMKSKD